MTKADYNKAKMFSNVLYRIGTDAVTDPDDINRAEFLYTWCHQQGREDIIAEAERLCNKRYNNASK